MTKSTTNKKKKKKTGLKGCRQGSVRTERNDQLVFSQAYNFIQQHFKIEIQLIYSSVLVSGTQQSDSVLYIYFFQIIFHCSLVLCVCVCVKATRSCLTLCNPMDCSPLIYRFLCPWNSPSKNAGVGSHSLLQGIFPAQGLNPGLLHCRQILYSLNYKIKVLT